MKSNAWKTKWPFIEIIDLPCMVCEPDSLVAICFKWFNDAVNPAGNLLRKANQTGLSVHRIISVVRETCTF